MALREFKEKSFAVVVAVLCLVGLIFVGFSILSIFRNRQGYLNEARIKSGAQAQILAENTAGVIYAVDLALMSIQTIYFHQQDKGEPVAFPVEHIIESELRFLPQIKRVVLLNSEGSVVYNNSAGAERFELPAFAEHRDAWLDFSMDIVNAAKDEAQVVLSRRLENRKAEFMGVLAAVMDPDFFYNRFNEYLNIEVNAIALADIKGRVLTTWFRDYALIKKFIGADIQQIPQFSSFSGAILSGGGRKTHENNTAIVSTHQLPGFPIQVAVSYRKADVLQKWRREAGRDIAIIFITTVIAVFTMTLAYRHQHRRQKAEQDLLEHHARLEETVAERTSQLAEANQELIQKNASLETALAEVKTLSGLLPICSYCKKIRDDKGYWNQIESYIHKHSDTEFSHSICPECALKYYPDMDLYGHGKSGKD